MWEHVRYWILSKDPFYCAVLLNLFDFHVNDRNIQLHFFLLYSILMIINLQFSFFAFLKFGFSIFIVRMILTLLFSCRYQPPLPVDQVKPLNEYEEEGGELISFFFYYFKE